MRKEFIAGLMISLAFSAMGQQLPFYTQYKSNMFMINPAVTGTKRLIDARLNYRNQWVGYEGAPQTTSFGIHSRLVKGKMGAGASVMQDNIGPFKKFNVAASYAFHLKFPDCELSAGLGGDFSKHTFAGDKVTLHNGQDQSVNQFITNSTWSSEAAAGIYLYNDRFHVGLSASQLVGSSAEFYKSDTTKKGVLQNEIHTNFTLGYNYSQNPDYIFESTIYGNYVPGIPFNLDYTLRVHFREQMFVGSSIRFGDALAFHVGFSFLNDFQVSYSYDLQIGKLKPYNSGSHEVMLVFSSAIFKSKHGRKTDQFTKQRYGYLF